MRFYIINGISGTIGTIEYEFITIWWSGFEFSGGYTLYEFNVLFIDYYSISWKPEQRALPGGSRPT